jgi:hypothetical protein
MIAEDRRMAMTACDALSQQNDALQPQLTHSVHPSLHSEDVTH